MVGSGLLVAQASVVMWRQSWFGHGGPPALDPFLKVTLKSRYTSDRQDSTWAYLFIVLHHSFLAFSSRDDLSSGLPGCRELTLIIHPQPSCVWVRREGFQ